MFAQTNGRNIYFDDVGSGPPIVFVPGTLSDHTIWAQVVEKLSGYRLVTMDLRDTGLSDCADEPYTSSDLTEDVFAVMDKAEIECAVLIGHSLGGVVVQECAIANSERIKAIVLCASWAKTKTAHLSIFTLWKAMRTTLCYRDFLKMMFLCGAGRMLRDSVSLDDMVGGFMENTQEQNPEAFFRQVDADLAVDTLSRLDKVEVPALVIGGEDDFLFSRDDQRVLTEALPYATLNFIAGAGHVVPMEEPELLATKIHQFITASV